MIETPPELLAVDPSISSAGVARFTHDEHGVAVCVAAARIPVTSEGPPGVRCLMMAAAIRRWVGHLRFSRLELAFEWPQIYTSAKSKGDPNQLIGIAGVGCALAGLLAGQGLIGDVLTPTPAEWIGQLPKVCPVCRGKAKRKCLACEGSAWKTPRGRRIRSRLSPAELAVIPDQNDAIDAVGIGLWSVGRLELVGVFPGAV